MHSGFLAAYDSVRARVTGAVEEALRSSSSGGESAGVQEAGAGGEQQPWQVYVTGHSLGGAMATLCAYELAARRWHCKRTLTPA